MVEIFLPDIPKGKEFEEYIASYFQETGHYVERNIIERHDEGEVLELDLVITDYYDKLPDRKLAEVKSGSCKFSDIFKVRGWMYYLDFDKGIFITQKKTEDFHFFKNIGNKIDIDVIQIGDLSKTNEALKEITGNESFDRDSINVWRYSYWLERELLDKLKKQAKSTGHVKRFVILDNYHHKINSEVFFSQNLPQRLVSLLNTFYKYPKISAKCGNEMIGDDFDKTYSKLPQTIFESTFNDCKNNLIQTSTYLEHKMRLSILKNAVDYKLFENAGINKWTTPFVDIKSSIFGSLRGLNVLPERFEKNLEKLSEDAYFYKYPVFWQFFLWLFGGFILKDYKEVEYALLSNKTGIPIEELPNAFDSYNKLFPLENGWFYDLYNSNIRVMKMFPIPFRGLGAYYRTIIHSEENNFENLKLTGIFTRKDLVKWNKSACNVLIPTLK